MSSLFEMKNGTRHWCPLSPLLFVLSLEPLLATIRKNPDLSVITLVKEEHKFAAFADDILFYITNPQITLPNLLNVLKQYGEISNFKINLAKSEILNINLSKSEERSLKNKFKFAWTKELKYLGIRLANTLENIYKINYLPLLDKVRIESKKLTSRSLSWIGRINIIKMVLLPKITYRFQMLPVALPQQYLRRLKILLMNSIWKKQESPFQY